jgi:hypothetical protein
MESLGKVPMRYNPTNHSTAKGKNHSGFQPLKNSYENPLNQRVAAKTILRAN